MKPQISVILPVYNAELYLNQTLKSILDQQGILFEVLAINDGSTDGTMKILSSYDDPRLKIIDNNHNTGLIYTLNRAIQLAKAPYIARIDADDVCLPGRFLKQFDFLEAHPQIAVVSTGAEFIDSEGNIIGKSKGPSIPDSHIKFHLLFGNIINHPSVMMRKDIFKHFHYDEKYYVAEDFGLWASLIIAGKSIHIIEEPLIRYRLHEKNISKSKFTEKHKSIKKIIQLQLDQYQITYTSRELDIQTSFAVRNMASVFNIEEISQWLNKFKSQLIEREWNAQIASEVFFYYFLQIYLTRYKKQPWKWLKYLFSYSSSMPGKFVDRFRLMSQVISEKVTN